jgi:cardiolipin synthase
MLKSAVRLLPNLITLARLVAVPMTIWAINSANYQLAFWLFFAAATSDALDGALARGLNARTTIGGYLDPLADKALLVAVYLTLGYHDQMEDWLVIMIVSRDLLIVGGALVVHLVIGQLRIKPLFISKANTLAQILLAGLVLAALGLGLEDGLLALRPLLTIVVAMTTLASGAAYVWVWGRRVLSEEMKA